ncbi:MAG: hypothetical protein FWD48_10780 [Oscillospiraceae bacterium]|nr:hypothetical protein [Oscillospiraceae bacterium]
MKRLIVILLAGVFLFSACTEGEYHITQPEQQGEAEEVTTTTEAPAVITTTEAIAVTTIDTTEIEPPKQLLDWEEAYMAVIEPYKNSNSNEDPYGAMLFDIDGDGIPELLLCYSSLDVRIEVYTFTNGEAVHLRHLTEGVKYKLDGYEGIYVFTGVGPYGVLFTTYFELIDNELLELNGGMDFTKTFADETDFELNIIIFAHFVNGIEVSEQEFEDTVKQYFNEDNRILPWEDIYMLKDAEKMFSVFEG